MPTPTPQKKDDRERVLSVIEALAGKQALKRIVFSKPSEKDIIRAELLPVTLRGKVCFQFAQQKKDGKMLHRNIQTGEIRAFAEEMLKSNPGSKLIFISGYMETEYLRSAIRLSVIDFIEKPIDVEQVRKALGRAVGEIGCKTARAAMNRAFYQPERRLFEIDETILQKRFMEPGIYGAFLRVLPEGPQKMAEWFESLFSDLLSGKYYQKEQVYTLMISLLTAVFRKYPEIYESMPQIGGEEELQADSEQGQSAGDQGLHGGDSGMRAGEGGGAVGVRQGGPRGDGLYRRPLRGGESEHRRDCGAFPFLPGVFECAVQAGEEGDSETVSEQLPAGEGEKDAGAGLSEDHGDRGEMRVRQRQLFCQGVPGGHGYDAPGISREI